MQVPRLSYILKTYSENNNLQNHFTEKLLHEFIDSLPLVSS